MHNQKSTSLLCTLRTVGLRINFLHIFLHIGTCRDAAACMGRAAGCTPSATHSCWAGNAWAHALHRKSSTCSVMLPASVRLTLHTL
jgi:hypothetical protein